MWLNYASPLYLTYVFTNQWENDIYGMALGRKTM